MQQETVPQETVPQEAVPQETVPQEAVPQEAVPQEAVPQEAVPQEAAALAGQGPELAKHATASVFVLAREPEGWRLGLIEHPRFARRMMPGGHVEAGESPAEAALREVAEETGLAVSLVPPPSAPLPPGYRPPRVAPPWWIVEYHVPPDGHLATAHVHVDYLYVALARDGAPAAAAGHPFGWYAAADLPGLRMFDDARLLAATVLAGLDGYPATGPAGHRSGEPGALLAAALAAGLASRGTG